MVCLGRLISQSLHTFGFSFVYAHCTLHTVATRNSGAGIMLNVCVAVATGRRPAIALALANIYCAARRVTTYQRAQRNVAQTTRHRALRNRARKDDSIEQA